MLIKNTKCIFNITSGIQILDSYLFITHQVFGPIVLPTMEEIVVGQALKHYRDGLENMKGTGYEKAIRLIFFVV